jgi:hypothetical protein
MGVVQKKMNPANDCFAKFDSDQLAKTCAFLVWNQAMQRSPVFVNAIPVAFGMMDSEGIQEETRQRAAFHRISFPTPLKN